MLRTLLTEKKALKIHKNYKKKKPQIRILEVGTALKSKKRNTVCTRT